MSKVYSPETINMLKCWVINTPPQISKNISIIDDEKKIEKKEIKIISPQTYEIIKYWISKSPPAEMFLKKRKSSIENLKL
tara:strand:- start:59 stop:298 length:240 start_codon:yes stop_codon:yes gene_type:complete